MSRCLSSILAVVLLAAASIAQTKPAGQVVALTLADGTPLKGTFSPRPSLTQEPVAAPVQ
jgi:hypothetical protein